MTLLALHYNYTRGGYLSIDMSLKHSYLFLKVLAINKHDMISD